MQVASQAKAWQLAKLTLKHWQVYQAKTSSLLKWYHNCSSPVHDTVNALGGNLHGLLDGIEAKGLAA
ncbi:hypothetical protein [Candidatus Minimicrobia naudis]